MKWNIGSSSSSLPAGHTAVSGASASGQPPASCPMHKSDAPSSGSVTVPITPSNAVASSSKAAECPIPHDRRSRPAASPYDVSSTPSSSRSSKDKGAACPIPHDQREFHPLNAIPMGLSATDKAPGQILDLPIDREISSIPRPKLGDATDEDHAGKWEYPSPQQFYNALVRKGQETPEESIEMVVAIHNFLNEQAWEEVLKWEKRLPGGDQAQLSRFQGRPGTLSPKARFHLWAGSLFPSKFNTEPPFDRHDWIVTRPIPATGNAAAGVKPVLTTTRYVIDYYSAPPDDHGNPVFSLDVRPALDSFESVSQRIRVGVEEWIRGESQ